MRTNFKQPLGYLYLVFAFLPLILVAQKSKPYTSWEQAVADSSKLINNGCRFTAFEQPYVEKVNFMDYIDTARYEMGMPDYTDFIYTINGQEYKFPAPYIEGITLVDQGIGKVGLFTVPKVFPNQWMWENYQHRTRAYTIQKAQQLWFKDLSQLKEGYDIYAFLVEKSDLQKVIEGGETLFEYYEAKDGATVYLSKYENGRWLRLGKFLILSSRIIPRMIAFRFVRECGLVRIKEYIDKSSHK